MMESLYIPLVFVFVMAAIAVSNRIYPPQHESETFDFMSISYSNACKGIAMLLIMIGHCTGLFAGGRFMTPLGGIGVSVFLIASGYGLNESFKKRGLAKYWSKRILRVWIPYAIITLAFAAFNLESIERLLEQLVCIKCAYWFVVYIILWYIIFYFATKWVCKYRIWVMLALAIASLFLMNGLQAEQAFGFVSGVALSQHIEWAKLRIAHKNAVVKLVAALSIVGILALALKQTPMVRAYDGTWIYNIVQLLIKYPLSLAIIMALQYVPRLRFNELLIFTGIISYELYLVHFRFYGYVGTNFLIALLVILGAYFASWAFSKLNTAIVKRLL